MSSSHPCPDESLTKAELSLDGKRYHISAIANYVRVSDAIGRKNLGITGHCGSSSRSAIAGSSTPKAKPFARCPNLPPTAPSWWPSIGPWCWRVSLMPKPWRSSEQVDSGPFLRRWVRKRWLSGLPQHCAQLWRGVSLVELFLFWGGDERGSDFAKVREDFPICVPVATHTPHAVGVALAFKLRHQQRVAVCAFGDGATSKGDVAEALNIAGVWHLPLVFVINNNHWAISVPVTQQTAAETLAQKAIAAGIEGEQVDGNDIIAVREAVARAVAKARAGGGPHLIEALTYRLSDHTTADDARRYRSDTDVSPTGEKTRSPDRETTSS